jgi:hypothetical protein
MRGFGPRILSIREGNMKNKIWLFSLLSLGLCLTASAQGPAWRAYVKLLNRMYEGLTPYKMPNPADGPGTIYFIDDSGVEQLYYDQKTAFPDLPLQGPVEIPTAHLSRMSNMQFKFGLNGAGQKILTNEVNLVAGLAITKDTTVTVSVAKPMVYRAQDGLINSKIVALDIRDSNQENILKKLQKPNVIVISGALHVDSFVYTFHRKSAIDSNLDANLDSKSKGLNVSYKKITDMEFTLEAKSPMFWAYYAYPIDRKEMEQLYRDKLRLREIQDRAERHEKYEQQLLEIEGKHQRIKEIAAKNADAEAVKYVLEKELEAKKNLLKATTSAAAAANLTNQVEGLEIQIGIKGKEIAEQQKQVEVLQQESRVFMAGIEEKRRLFALGEQDEMTSLAAVRVRDLEEMNLLKKKEYRLFGDKVIVRQKRGRGALA